MGYLIGAYVVGAVAGGLLGRSLGMMRLRRSDGAHPDPRRWALVGATLGGLVCLGWLLLVRGGAVFGA